MFKRDITETVYEYDNEGKLIKKTVTERHEEEHPDNVLNDWHNDWWKNNSITCDNPNATITLSDSTNNTNSNKLTSNCTIQG